jgi:hypothetical protein
MTVVRVNDNYRALSEALLKLGCAIETMFPNQAEDICVLFPKHIHQELFGICKNTDQVRVEGPFGHYPIDCK